MTSPLMKAYNSVSTLEAKVNSFQAKTLQATAKAGSGFQSLSNSVNKTESNLNRLEHQSHKTGTGLSKMTSMAGRLFAAIGAYSSIKTLFNMGVDAEQTNIKFEVLLGSAEKAKSLISEVNEYANKTPYENMGLQKAAETMLGFGIAQDKIMPSMKMLGDVAMGNEEKLSGLSLVYSQIMATGRLMGQDLLQLINQGFNPLQIISEHTGLSMLELKDRMEKGAISATMVEEAFRLATSEGGRYYQMADKMSQTAGGLWSTLLGTLREQVKGVGLDFANSLVPALKTLISLAENIPVFINWLKEMKPVIYGVVGAIAAYVAITKTSVAITALQTWWTGTSTAAIVLSTLVTEGWSMAWLALNLAMSANPIGLVVIAVAALVGAVIWAWNKFEGFRGAIMGVWEVMKGLGTMIKNIVVNRFKELLNAIGAIGKSLWALMNGDFKQAFEYGKSAMTNLTGVNSAKQAFEDGKKAFQSFGKGYDAGVKMGGIKNPLATKMPTAPKGINGANSGVFDDLINGGGGNGTKGGSKSTGKKGGVRSAAGDVISGGKKQTNIIVNIGKLQDKTEIHVHSTEKGLNRLSEKVQEELLRAVNSLNQLQTS